MLDPLQEQLREIVDNLPESQTVALAGGGALVARGVVARPTQDLDYFATSQNDVDRLAVALEKRLTGGGFTVDPIRLLPGFARFRVSRGGASTMVDLTWDARLFPPERFGGGMVLAEAELAADKMLAVAERGEPRDYIDLAALVDRRGFWGVYATAVEKQPGLDPRQLLYAFRYFGELPRVGFGIPTADYHHLQTIVDGWSHAVAQHTQGHSAGGLREPGSAPHDEPQPTGVNPISVSVRPHRASPAGWELVVRGAGRSPLVVSEPYPTEAEVLSARDFALKVANGPHPILFHGWTPWLGAQGVSHTPPPVDEAATTVRIRPPTAKAPTAWKLQARRPDGTVIRTSLPYPTREAADRALDYLGTLTAMAGAPDRAGPVKDTTLGRDRECACQTLGAHCLHFEIDDPHTRKPDRSITLGINVRPYHRDNRGWEVVTMEPDGSPWRTSGPHRTIEDAEQARDFMARLVNTHPQLHILGWDPQIHFGPDATPYEPPPRDQAPSVGIYPPEPDAPWFVQCRNPDGTLDDTSPAYPTYQAADEALDQLGLLSMATDNCAIGHRAAAQAADTYCPCSRSGWACEHIEDDRAVEAATHDRSDRGSSLSL